MFQIINKKSIEQRIILFDLWFLKIVFAATTILVAMGFIEVMATKLGKNDSGNASRAYNRNGVPCYIFFVKVQYTRE